MAHVLPGLPGWHFPAWHFPGWHPGRVGHEHIFAGLRSKTATHEGMARGVVEHAEPLFMQTARMAREMTHL